MAAKDKEEPEKGVTGVKLPAVTPPASPPVPKVPVGPGQNEAAQADEMTKSANAAAQKFVAPEASGPDEAEVAEVRKRSKSGNVFIVKKDELLHGPGIGKIAADSDFPAGTDFVYLMERGIIEPINGLKADPRAAQRTPDSLDEVERLHTENSRLQTECERLTAECERLTAELKTAKK